MYVNDIANVIKCGILMYADDLKVFSTIGDIVDAHNLQTKIEILQKWAINNKLDINVGKCAVVSYTNAKSKIAFDYKINDCLIPRRSSFKDLGVTFNSTLSFKEHIGYVTKSAYSSMGIIMRNCGHLRNVETLKMLYTTYVRPKLEYCSHVWSPHLQYLRNDLENIQRKFLKWLHFKKYGEYPPRGTEQATLLNEFQLQKLVERRICCEVLFLRKLIAGEVDAPQLIQDINLHVPRLNSKVRSSFQIEAARIDVYKFAPMRRMCVEANSMCSSVDLFHCDVSEIRNAVKIAADAIAS